jgi:dTMP kinase
MQAHYKGIFISIEGPDKAGKTTQLKMLKEYSEKNTKEWLFKRNPGGTDWGKRLRNIVLDSKETISDMAELMIYIADRAHHVDQLLRPNLEAGHTIICDRFIDSTMAYQGYGRQMDLKLIDQMNIAVCAEVRPTLSILLTVSEKVAHERSKGAEKDRLEQESKLFFVRVRNGYNTIAKGEPERYKVISTDFLTPEEVHQQVTSYIEEHIVDIATLRRNSLHR